MSRRSENLVLALLVASAAVAIWVCFLPYLAVSHIKRSLERGDADALSRDIDFPTLRSNLKDQLNYLIASQATTGTENNPFTALGALIGGSFANNMIDAYVTPYGLSQIITHQAQIATDKPQQGIDKQRLDRLFKTASCAYDSPSRFFVTLHGDNGEQIKVVLTRNGLSWRLTNILLPADLVSSGSSGSSAQRMRVREDVQAIKTQLQLYESISGVYPTTEQGLQALVTQPQSDPRPARWYQLFRELPKDPWGNGYIYRNPGVKNPGSYDLFSAGPDRQADTRDDDWGDG